MKSTKLPTILNSKGEPIRLTRAEQYHADWTQKQVNERFSNALGYEIQITTLTTIAKKISEQKFYTIPFADYLPVVVGQGTWSSNITFYRSFDIADEFETGIINLGGGNARQATTDTGVDALNVKIQNWSKTNGWSIFELEEASKSGNWSLIEAKEKSRKRNWDLGLQYVAFLGAKGLNGASGPCLGLLNQGSAVTTNSSVITAPISGLSTSNLKILTAALYETYRSNCNRTAKPNRFVIPESDYNGLAAQVSPDFPIKTILELLEQMFQVITQDKSFKVLPSAYGDSAYNGLSKQIYALYNADEESINMQVPLDYTNTLANSIDNFNFQNAGYGQFSGVTAIRPLEMLYFSY